HVTLRWGSFMQWRDDTKLPSAALRDFSPLDVRFGVKSGQAGRHFGKSALCQKQTYASQQTASLFDHLVWGRTAPVGHSRQAAALFLIAPTIAVSMAPPAPPAITCEMMPSTLRLPDCAAAVIAGSNKVTI